jgi:hypothetical protein
MDVEERVVAAQTPEGKVKDAIVKILKSEDVWYYRHANFGVGRGGVPDFLCCINGRFLAIEAKAAHGVVTANQLDELNAIHACGGRYIVVGPDKLLELRAKITQIRRLPSP